MVQCCISSHRPKLSSSPELLLPPPLSSASFNDGEPQSSGGAICCPVPSSVSTWSVAGKKRSGAGDNAQCRRRRLPAWYTPHRAIKRCHVHAKSAGSAVRWPGAWPRGKKRPIDRCVASRHIADIDISSVLLSSPPLGFSSGTQSQRPSTSSAGASCVVLSRRSLAARLSGRDFERARVASIASELAAWQLGTGTCHAAMARGPRRRAIVFPEHECIARAWPATQWSFVAGHF